MADAEYTPSPGSAEGASPTYHTDPPPAEPASAGVGSAQSAKQQRTAKQRATDSLKARLFDPKQRAIGIDKHALDEQVKEKKMIKDLEKAREAYFAQQSLQQDKMAKWSEQEVLKQKKESALDQESFRREKQKRELRREWDLNDPHRLRHDLPPRLGDDDPRCTVSGLQKFEGEDIDAADRRMAQAKQLQRWAQQQIQESNMRKKLEKEMDALMAERSEAVTHKAWAMERNIEKRRTEQAVSCAEFNKRLAAQKEREKLADKHFEQQCNMQEIQNMLDSDFLNEDQRVTVNPRATAGRSAGTNAPLYKRDNMKGMHASQRADILAEQEAQRLELSAKRAQEKEEQRQIDLQEEQERRMAAALERQRMRERRQDRVNLGSERKAQAAEAQVKRANLDQMYRNEIDDRFYAFIGSNVR